MSTQPFVQSRYRALDANGAPLAGGLLYTYAAGTSTPLATYTDYAGGTPNANPVVLDANGGADVWLTAGVLYKFVLQNSLGVVQNTVDNFPAPAAQSANTDVSATTPGGRLTLSASVPVPTTDQASATTIYYLPYASDKVPLYDGTNWTLYSIGASGLSQATADNTKSPAGMVANSNYDLFVWNDAGTVRLSRGVPWSSDTARGGSALIQQVNGRYVNSSSIANGPAATLGLYVGTVRSDGASQANDTLAKRFVWNTYNRVERQMLAVDATGNWTNNGAVRQANGNTANQLNYVCGLAEDAIAARVVSTAAATVVGTQLYAAIGLDSTSVGSGLITLLSVNTVSYFNPLYCSYMGIPGLGYHYLAWLEHSNAATTTWYGTFSTMLSGISGSLRA